MKPVRPIHPGLIDDRRRLDRGAALAALTCVMLAGCEQNTFVPPPPPKVEVANPRAAADHALSGGHRQHRGDQVRRSGRAGAGLSAIDRLQGRHLREGRHDPVHDRARDLQAEARAGAGGGGRRARPRSSRPRPTSSGRPIWSRARRSRRQPSIPRPRRATTRRPICSRRRPTPGSPRSITATPR